MKGKIWTGLLLIFVALASFASKGTAQTDGSQLLKTVNGQHSTAEIALKDGLLVYDLVFAGPESVGADTARKFMLEMAALPDSVEFTEVTIAYKGRARYRIGGNDIRTLAKGFRLGDMAAFRKLMQLPSIVQTLDSGRAFPVRQGTSIASMSARAGDFNKMLSHWYLAELIEELRTGNP